VQKLIDLYGKCTIPKNTLLFRGHADTSFDDCMFFATKKWVAGAFNNEIQIWHTKTDITVLFLVEYVDKRSWTISALPRLFNNIFPLESNPDFDDLDIKHWDINRRNKLTSELHDKYKIFGWLTSLENKIELEVCLFDKQVNANHLQLLDIVDRKGHNYFKDSLFRIKIYPTKSFYDKTIQKLNKQAPYTTIEKDCYKEYKRMINALINEEVQKGMDNIEAKHYYFDLRLKLKI